jgi:DNA-binding transcriptional regulator PaaX
MPAKPTKIETVLKLLRRPSGASIAQLQKTTGWQSHSVRAALTGVRKKGHTIERKKDANGVTRYCIAGEQ